MRCHSKDKMSSLQLSKSLRRWSVISGRSLHLIISPIMRQCFQYLHITLSRNVKHSRMLATLLESTLLDSSMKAPLCACHMVSSVRLSLTLLHLVMSLSLILDTRNSPASWLVSPRKSWVLSHKFTRETLVLETWIGLCSSISARSSRLLMDFLFLSPKKASFVCWMQLRRWERSSQETAKPNATASIS